MTLSLASLTALSMSSSCCSVRTSRATGAGDGAADLTQARLQDGAQEVQISEAIASNMAIVFRLALNAYNYGRQSGTFNQFLIFMAWQFKYY